MSDWEEKVPEIKAQNGGSVAFLRVGRRTKWRGSAVI
jgi:hypothetical protein